MEDMAAVKNQMLYQKHCRASANNKCLYPFYIWKYHSFYSTQTVWVKRRIEPNYRRTLAFTSELRSLFL